MLAWTRILGMLSRRRRSSLAACATVFLALFTLAATAAELSNGGVKIGILNDQAGPFSDLAGQGSVVAARLAVEDFQKQHPGVRVEIVAADHQNKADIGAQIARRWFDLEGVDAIADVTNSSVALAVQSIAREKKKLVFYSAVGTTEISGKQCSETGLAWLHDSYNLVAGPVRSIVAQGMDSWFFISADYAFGRNIVSEAQRVLTAAGGKSVGSVFHPIGATDYSAFLLQAQASGAKVIAFGNAGMQLVTTMKQWHEFGMNSDSQRPVALIMFLTDAHGIGPVLGRGLTALTAWYWDLDDESRAFSARFFKHHGKMPTEAQASMYSAVLHYLRAVAAAKTDETRPVLDQMRATAVDDFFARGARLRADGKLVHDFYLIRIRKASEVGDPWKLYDVVEKVRAEDAYAPLSESECPLVTQSAVRR